MVLKYDYLFNNSLSANNQTIKNKGYAKNNVWYNYLRMIKKYKKIVF